MSLVPEPFSHVQSDDAPYGLRLQGTSKRIASADAGYVARSFNARVNPTDRICIGRIEQPDLVFSAADNGDSAGALD